MSKTATKPAASKTSKTVTLPQPAAKSVKGGLRLDTRARTRP